MSAPGADKKTAGRPPFRLCGDVGGTKVLLGLVDATGAIHDERRLASADFASFAALLDEFLRNASMSPDGGCLAVAGPVADDGRSAKITNLPWRIDCAALEARHALTPGSLRLINDFAGAALGVTVAPAGLQVTLQAGAPDPRGAMLVVGAGTGLGMAVLFAAETGWRVLASEGGHVAFAPTDDDQLRVWTALRHRYGRVTWERIVSGPGLVAIHETLTGAVRDAAAIGTLALAGDAAARRSVDVFMAAYGAFAGDMALAVMARGGVHLAGGIATKLLPLLQSGPFITAFNAKAEHAALARAMAVHVATDPSLGLRGAAVCALSGH